MVHIRICTAPRKQKSFFHSDLAALAVDSTEHAAFALILSSCLESTARATLIIIIPKKRAVLILIHSSKRINLFLGAITNDVRHSSHI